MKILENKVAIITGAGSGIGKAIAELFAEEGARVVVSDVDETKGNKVVKGIQKMSGEAFFIKVDGGYLAQ